FHGCRNQSILQQYAVFQLEIPAPGIQQPKMLYRFCFVQCKIFSVYQQLLKGKAFDISGKSEFQILSYWFIDFMYYEFLEIHIWDALTSYVYAKVNSKERQEYYNDLSRIIYIFQIQNVISNKIYQDSTAYAYHYNRKQIS